MKSPSIRSCGMRHGASAGARFQQGQTSVAAYGFEIGASRWNGSGTAVPGNATMARPSCAVDMICRQIAAGKLPPRTLFIVRP